jgi:hypothetical protein
MSYSRGRRSYRLDDFLGGNGLDGLAVTIEPMFDQQVVPDEEVMCSDSATPVI